MTVAAFIPSGVDKDVAKKHIEAMIQGREVEWFVETEPANLHLDERFTLWTAIEHARENEMSFAVASIKGLTERRYQTFALLEEICRMGIPIEVADDPDVACDTVNVLSAQALLTRNRIIQRSRQSLERIKKRIEEQGEYTSKSGRKISKLGATIGQDALSQAGNAEKSKRIEAHTREVQAIIEPLLARGVNQGKIAAALNRKGLRTYRGKLWTQYGVSRIVNKWKSEKSK